MYTTVGVLPMLPVFNGYINRLEGAEVTTKYLPYTLSYGINWPEDRCRHSGITRAYSVCDLSVSNVSTVKAVYIDELSLWAIVENTPVLPVLDDVVVYPLSYYYNLERYKAIIAHITLYPIPIYNINDKAICIGVVSSGKVSWRNNKKIMFEEEDVFKYAGEVYPLKTKYIDITANDSIKSPCEIYPLKPHFEDEEVVSIYECMHNKSRASEDNRFRNLRYTDVAKGNMLILQYWPSSWDGITIP